MAEHVVIKNDAAKHVQAYIDYVNLVGDYDGQQMMNEEEFEQFKKKMQQNAKNRIYTSWRNARGVDCKMVGPATKCFCDHRYKDHEYLNPKDKKPHCKVPKCTCPCYYYVPAYGSYDFKCLCKHSYKLHDPVTKKCSQGKCGCNVRFNSTWSCSCGSKFNEHQTVFETRQERVQQGKPVDDMMRLGNELNAPMMQGGLMSFGAMVNPSEGYEAYIDELGGVQGNQKAVGYKEMKAIKSNEQEGSEQKQQNSKLKNLNKKLKEEQKIDDYDHNVDADDDKQINSQKKPISKPSQQQIKSNKNSKQPVQNEDDDDNQQYVPDEDQQQQQENFDQDEEGQITAYKLFTTPHQYCRVKVPARIKKY